jgi:3-oxoacyl-[acyl-carrier protein] reductase
MENMTRIALIIGGASGIGAASAVALAEDGFTIAVADLNLAESEAHVTRLPSSGHACFSANLGDEASLIALFDAVEHSLGPVNVLVISAGTNGYVDGKRPNLRATTLENWNLVQSINATGPFLAIREMFKRRELLRADNSRIILISSMAAQNAAVNSPPSYVASKGAIMALTKVAAGEGAALGITVNAVAPGAIDTPMLRAVMSEDRDAAYFGQTVAGRAGSPKEVAAAVRFLAAPGSSYVNGACIDVNGGLLMR